ncbi:MAG: ROK family protein [Fimbriimonadales bacterium]|nr:ROK family protein [Fimbriimonadales bacterium]
MVGVDIGGTKTALCLWENGLVEDRAMLPTEGYAATLDRVAEWVLARRPVAVGVGCRGPLDEETGFVECVTPTDWHERPLGGDLSRLLGLPLRIVNDADAALLGELGEGESEPVLLLTLGTGVGGALWTGEGRYRGAFGEHPEIGHVPVLEDGPPCACGLRGCLEHALCRGGLLHQADQAGFGADVEGFLRSGCEGALRLRRAVERAVALFAHAYRPSRIVFGGGVADEFGDLLLPFGEVPRDRLPFLQRPLVLERARHGNWAGAYGAARLAIAVAEGRRL